MIAILRYYYQIDTNALSDDKFCELWCEFEWLSANGHLNSQRIG